MRDKKKKKGDSEKKGGGGVKINLFFTSPGFMPVHVQENFMGGWDPMRYGAKRSQKSQTSIKLLTSKYCVNLG